MQSTISPQAAETKIVTPKKVQRTRIISSKDADLFFQAKACNEAWKLNPNVILFWTTQQEFEALIQAAYQNYSSKNKTKGNRPAITDNLKQLDAQIDSAVAAIKTYLIKKFKNEKAAIPHYAKFGISHVRSTYILPRDRNLRIEALLHTITAIKDEGFENEEFGVTFWTNMRQTYKDAYELSTVVDGEISKKAGDKNQQTYLIRKVLIAIKSILKGQYPDTYKSELRNWGFQKDKY